MAGSPTRRRNRANPDTVPPAAPAAPPMTINVGTAAPAPAATVTLATPTAEVQAAEADLRATMTRLLGSANQGGQIIAKRVVGAEERWLCNMGTKDWDESSFATRFGAGSFALYIYGPDGSGRGRIPWAVDDSVGPGQPPPGATLAANQPRNVEAQSNGGVSENALVMMVKTLAEANTALMSKLADSKGSGGGFGFEQYIKLMELQNASRPKIADIDSMFSLGMKMAQMGNSELPAWASVIEGALPVLEPISRAIGLKIASPGGGMRPQLRPQQRPQIAARNGANGQAATPGKAAQIPAQVATDAPKRDAETSTDAGAGVSETGQPSADETAPAVAQTDAEQTAAFRMVLATIMRTQPKNGEEDGRDPTTYANLLLDVMGEEYLETFAAQIPEGTLADLLLLQVPGLKPSEAFIREVEIELREQLAESQPEDPVLGQVGTSPDQTKAAV